METKTWDSLLTLTKGLCGVTSFASDEETLIAAFLNRRIYAAYRASNMWPRYLVCGEARAAASSIIPFTQTSLNSIDTALRVYEATPYATSSVREYDFYAGADGIHVINNAQSITTFYVDYKKRLGDAFNGTTNTAVPLEFYEYAAHGAYSDFLRYDKQTDKALVAEQEADRLLMVELANPMLQLTAQTAGRRIRTHASQQSR